MDESTTYEHSRPELLTIDYYADNGLIGLNYTFVLSVIVTDENAKSKVAVIFRIK